MEKKNVHLCVTVVAHRFLDAKSRSFSLMDNLMEWIRHLIIYKQRELYLPKDRNILNG